MFEIFKFSKFRLTNGYFSEIRKTAILFRKSDKIRTTAKIVRNIQMQTI